MYTIREANYGPAVAMRVENDFGTVSEGKWADRNALKSVLICKAMKMSRITNLIGSYYLLYLSRLANSIGSICTTGN